MKLILLMVLGFIVGQFLLSQSKVIASTDITSDCASTHVGILHGTCRCYTREVMSNLKDPEIVWYAINPNYEVDELIETAMSFTESVSIYAQCAIGPES